MRGCDAKQNQGSLHLDRGILYNDNRRFIGPGWIGRAKTTEIMVANQHPRGPAHGGSVERLFHPPDVLLEECRSARRDLVEVGARDGIVTGVKIVFRLGHGDDAEISGKALVQCARSLGW